MTPKVLFFEFPIHINYSFETFAIIDFLNFQINSSNLKAIMFKFDIYHFNFLFLFLINSICFSVIQILIDLNLLVANPYCTKITNFVTKFRFVL